MSEARGDWRTQSRRALGPVNLLTLGVGAIIGAGISSSPGRPPRNLPARNPDLVRARWNRVRVRWSLLRRVRLDDPDSRQCLHVFLRDAGRTGRLDHRVGPDPGIRIRCSDRCRRMERQLARISPGHRIGTAEDAAIDLHTLRTPLNSNFDYIGFLVILVITAILVIGIKESANFTSAIVFLKVAVVCVFVALATMFLVKHNWQPNHWHPFLPANTGERGQFGWSGFCAERA